MEETIVNRVASSGLISLDLEELYDTHERIVYDLKDNLFMGLILKEKDFRAFLKNHDWSIYKDKNVAITCSEDAIVPTWAYMLLATYIEPVAHAVVFGDSDYLEKSLFEKAIARLDLEQYKDARVVIKGCSKVEVPVSAYVEITNRLRPIAKSIMFGEPCSTVPLYKKKVN
jgi:hypothetical protein